MCANLISNSSHGVHGGLLSCGQLGVIVTLSAFSIGKYEVTQALYESVMGYNPSYFNGYTDSPSRPVETVTWYTDNSEKNPRVVGTKAPNGLKYTI